MLHGYPMYAYIPARDMARARQFYEGKVGLKPKEEANGGVVYEFAQGTACFLYPTPNAGTSLASEKLLRAADEVLFEAKRDGRNRIHCAAAATPAPTATA